MCNNKVFFLNVGAVLWPVEEEKKIGEGKGGGCHGLGLMMEPILVGHEILTYLHHHLCMS